MEASQSLLDEKDTFIDSLKVREIELVAEGKRLLEINEIVSQKNANISEDLARMKLIHKNFQTEVEKNKERLREEINNIKTKKLEVEDRYDRILREREQMKVKEKTLLKIFDVLDVDQILQEKESGNGFKCSICKHTEKTLSELKKHVQDKHFSGETSEYCCDECNYEATTKKELNNHKLSVHEAEKISFLCTECDFQCEEENKLDDHQAVKHNIGNSFQCDKCKFVANTEKKLGEHSKKNHKTVNVDILQGTQEKRKQSKFTCDECGFIGRSINNLNGHKASKHEGVNPGQKSKMDTVYTCAGCNFKGTSKKELNDHKETHDRNKEYSCDKCYITVQTMAALKNHRNTEHTYTLFHCGKCDYKSSNMNVLNTHRMDVHGSVIHETKREKSSPLPHVT